jgi:hypothetical protein
MTKETYELYYRYTLVDDACIYLALICFYQTLRIIIFAENELMDGGCYGWECDQMKGDGQGKAVDGIRSRDSEV